MIAVCLRDDPSRLTDKQCTLWMPLRDHFFSRLCYPFVSASVCHARMCCTADSSSPSSSDWPLNFKRMFTYETMPSKAVHAFCLQYPRTLASSEPAAACNAWYRPHRAYHAVQFSTAVHGSKWRGANRLFSCVGASLYIATSDLLQPCRHNGTRASMVGGLLAAGILDKEQVCLSHVCISTVG